MVINLFALKENTSVPFSEDIDFSSIVFSSQNIKAIPFAHADVVATNYGDIIRLQIHIKADVVAVCSYSLEDTPLKLNFKDEIDFSSEIDNDELEPIEGNSIDVDRYVLSLILSRIPIKVVKPGKKPPQNGDGYRIISEEELTKERNDQHDSRWDKLDDLKF